MQPKVGAAPSGAASRSAVGVPAGRRGRWVATDALSRGRSAHTATRLRDGRVLVAGGAVGHERRTAQVEVFDPGAERWTGAGSLVAARSDHAASLLPSGHVIVTGGAAGGGVPRPWAEVYDPATDTWTGLPEPRHRRVGHAVAVLAGGGLLVAGGYDPDTGRCLRSVEALDVVAGTWSALPALASPRCRPTATVLTDGRVLVVGGYDDLHPSGHRSCEVLDADGPAWRLWPELPEPRDTDGFPAHAALLVTGGSVLVLGGWDDAAARFPAACLRYDLGGEGWQTASPMRVARGGAAVGLLHDGSVLAAGGLDDYGPVAVAERYEPRTDRWTALAPLMTPRLAATLTPLGASGALVVGGEGPNSPYADPLRSVEMLLL